MNDLRAKSRILQSGAYFHICGLKKSERKNVALFKEALEKKGFVIVELKVPLEGIEIEDFYQD